MCQVHDLYAFYTFKLCLFQDETPLFLAAREGSYKTAKVLLDRYANRDVTDHMDRLPRDIAQERNHMDIVHLLEEYHVKSPLNNGVTSPNIVPSPYSNSSISKAKGKRRSKNMRERPMSPTAQNEQVSVPQRKARKKKTVSPARHRNIPSDHERSSMGTLSPELESPTGISEIPPSYESAMMNGHLQSTSQADDVKVSNNLNKGAIISKENCTNSVSDSNYLHENSVLDQNPEWLDTVCTLANSQQIDGKNPSCMLANGQPNTLLHSSSVTTNHKGPSPLCATTTQSSLGVPNLLNQTLSPMPMNRQSPPITNTISPLRNKNNPTSPTHMQAMAQHAQINSRAQQRQHNMFMDPHSNFIDGNTIMPTHFLDPVHTSLQQNGMAMVPDHFPSPPSQHSHISDATPKHMGPIFPPETYLTPSPDSPGHWSSSSPQSANSDWSEGISSPPQLIHNKIQLRPPNKQDSVYI